ncbi:YheC/YheD family protein [Cohnella sp. AR92]|uniref:YheC/YheD family protein n=1 Tax=Cohnella sp. AR92 TaxID=648716 RepID=UPI000F8E32FF|nr:YheC/YheD family protein [Cohnella sp. AR92]RUS47268.1 YheC/YheD family protein [Cohnella sp. AR92]
MGTKPGARSKWAKTQCIVGVPRLAAHVPETRIMSEASLRAMLGKYGMVYVKPDIGARGVGVMKVEKLDKGYFVHYGTVRKKLATFESAFRWIKNNRKKRVYLVQRGIRMVRLGNRPIDYRVMIQRNEKRKWEVTGSLARVAHPGKAVTNGSQGGTIYPSRTMLDRIAGSRRGAAILGEFRGLAHLSARRLAKVYPKLNELGLDIAMDNQNRSWILEINTAPDAKPFVLLDDQSMIKRIVKLGKRYGRIYDLTIRKAKKG